MRQMFASSTIHPYRWTWPEARQPAQGTAIWPGPNTAWPDWGHAYVGLAR